MTNVGTLLGDQCSVSVPVDRPRTDEAPAVSAPVAERHRGTAERALYEQRGDEVRGTGMSAAFDSMETAVSYGWEQLEYGTDGEQARLSLSARMHGSVRGTLHRPTVFHHTLEVDGWELTGPPELPPGCARRARHALTQLRLRMAGHPHTSPDADGRWDVSVRQRLRVTGGEEVPGQLTPHWGFIPTEMFVEVSTSGGGSMCLFGAGPVETDSKRYVFAVGLGGVTAYDRWDSSDQVPLWAREPADRAARLASELHAAADQQLVDETTGPPTWAGPAPRSAVSGP